MKTLKWRVALAVVNTVAALVLTALALREYTTFEEAHPGAFYHGNANYVTLSEKISYSWNAPSFVTAMWIHHVHRSWLGWSDDWFHFGSLEYYICVFVFWWFVGWSLDNRSEVTTGMRQRASFVAILGIAFSLFLLFQVINGIHSRFTDNHAILISTAIWMLALVCLSGWFLLKSKTAQAD